MLSESTALRLESALRELARVNLQQTNVQKAALQQTYTLDDLHERYHGKSRDEIRRDLLDIKAIPETGTQGRAITVPLDSVLMLDAIYNGRLAVLRADPVDLPKQLKRA